MKSQRKKMPDKTVKILNTREGSYKILFTLGSGGFGTVYSGRDEKNKRNVAIKVSFITVCSCSEKIYTQLKHRNLVKTSIRCKCCFLVYGCMVRLVRFGRGSLLTTTEIS